VAVVGGVLLAVLAVGAWLVWAHTRRPFDVVAVATRTDISVGDTLSPPPPGTRPTINSSKAYAIAHGAPFTREHRPVLRLGILGNTGEGVNPGAMQGQLVWVLSYHLPISECPASQGDPPYGGASPSHCDITQFVDATTGRLDGGVYVNWTPTG
jgi:hypothetical protein